MGVLSDTGSWLKQTLWGAGYTVNLLLDTGAKAYTLPRRVRFLLASDPALCRAVRRSFLRAVFASGPRATRP